MKPMYVASASGSRSSAGSSLASFTSNPCAVSIASTSTSPSRCVKMHGMVTLASASLAVPKSRSAFRTMCGCNPIPMAQSSVDCVAHMARTEVVKVEAVRCALNALHVSRTGRYAPSSMCSSTLSNASVSSMRKMSASSSMASREVRAMMR